MIINDILDIDSFECIEPTFDALIDEYYTSLTLDTRAAEGRLLIDETDYPVAIALNTEGGWRVASFVARASGIPLIEKMEEVGGDIYRESREVWMTALREYYSRIIMEEVPPALEDTRPERVEMVRALIHDLWGEGRFSRCIDCCCGSGVGSAVLRDAGIIPVAYDNDAALLSLGLNTGRLRPEETMCIDATRATAYLDVAEAGICLMMGDISSFTSGMWEQITNELLALTDVTLITAATEPEIRRIEEWCTIQDRECEIFEQESDPIYDRWVCQARLI
jgi:hypothetical protein